MRLKDILLKEEQLNEFVWTPASTAGLVMLVGPTAAAWILIAIVCGIFGALGLAVAGVGPMQAVKNWKRSRENKQLGKSLSEQDVKELCAKVKLNLSVGQKSYATKIENELTHALKEKNYKRAGDLLKQLKHFEKSTSSKQQSIKP